MSIYVTFVSSLVHGPGAVLELHGVRLVKVTAENRQIGRESRNFEPYLYVCMNECMHVCMYVSK
jgi:hypothetical protein